MAKKEDMFGLMAAAAFPLASPQRTSLALREGRQLTEDQQQMVEEFDTQMLVIEGQEVKTAYAMGKVAEMHEMASVAFECAAATIATVKQLAKGQEYEPYVEEFSDRQRKMLGRHMLGLVDVGATKIAEEVHRTLHLPPVPPKRRGWFR